LTQRSHTPRHSTAERSRLFSTRQRRSAWLVALLAAALLGSLTLAHERHKQASEAAVHETLAVQRVIADCLSILKDAETGQRGFLLTGDAAFLAPYESARRALPMELARLDQLLAADEGQMLHAREFRRLTSSKLDELAATIELEQTGRPGDALSRVRTGVGRRLMDGLRAEAEQMLAREGSRLAEREQAAEADRRRGSLLAVGASTFVLCIVAAGFWSALRGVAEARRAHDQLLESGKALRALADNATDLVRIIDARGQLSYVSPSSEPLLGFSREEMLAMGPRALMHDDERDVARELREQLLAGNASQRPLVHRLRCKSGGYRWFETSCCLSREPAADAPNIHLTSRDITARKQAEQEREESEQRLRTLSEASFEGVAISKDGVLIDTNALFASWFGREPGGLVGTDSLALFAPEDRPQMSQLDQASGPVCEAHLLRNDGSSFPVEVRGRDAIFRGDQVRISVIRDITERRQREAELKHQAELLRTMSLRDELTGLYNRRGFLEHTQQQLRSAARTRRAASVFFVDLNAMKTINDTWGHEAGDRALVAAARTLSQVFRDSDVVSRLGGDEFAVLAADCGAEEVDGVRDRLQRGVEELNASAREPFRVSISVGSAVFDPTNPTDLNTLMAAADRSMYEEKSKHSQRASSERGLEDKRRAALG
jgi:diguanylate cyclase (GGDEF)-like protein/PAS domain S-box-containing protein